MDVTIKRKLLTGALRIVLLILLRTHTYEFPGSLKLKKEGGPIGMEITGVVAQVSMVCKVVENEVFLSTHLAHLYFGSIPWEG